MKKVLVITYYWPPSGGSGVQRTLKFVKYLRDFGWEPVVYTVENGEYPVYDYSLEKEIPEGIEVIRQPIWEPYGFYKKFTGKKKDEKLSAGMASGDKKSGLKEKAARWIRGNFFIPDARRFWIRPSVKFLRNYLKNHDIDLIYSSGPPHSVHLIGKKLKQASGLPWVADFRDPWSKIFYLDEMMLSTYARKRHENLERQVLETADKVVVVGQDMKRSFKEIVRREIEVISNGFDPPDFRLDEPVKADEKFSIVYIGTFMSSQNPPALWQALRDKCDQDPHFAADLQLKFAGKTDASIMQSIREYQLEKHLTDLGYLPHDEILQIERSAQVLLLVINRGSNARGILTGKLFEYLAVKRPILCIGPTDGDAAAIILQADAGKIATHGDVEGVRKLLDEWYEAWKAGELEVESKGLEAFTRKALTGRLAGVFEQALD